MKFRCYLNPIIFFILAIFFINLSHAQSQPTYTLAVVPQFPPLEIHRNWIPVLNYLEETTGVHFELKVYDSIPIFEQEFLKGVPDFIYLNPYHMVMAARAHKYTPLIRDGKNMLSGVLVVSNTSPIKSVAELNNKPISFPAPNAFGASLYLRALLIEKFKIKIKPEYVRTHSNAYRYVITGATIAAGGVRATLEKESNEIRQQLRILYETPAVAPHPIAAHPRVPTAIQSAVQHALLKLDENEAGRALLKKIQIVDPILADYKNDYSVLDELGLEKYVVIETDQK